MLVFPCILSYDQGDDEGVIPEMSDWCVRNFVTAETGRSETGMSIAKKLEKKKDTAGVNTFENEQDVRRLFRSEDEMSGDMIDTWLW